MLRLAICTTLPRPWSALGHSHGVVETKRMPGRWWLVWLVELAVSANPLANLGSVSLGKPTTCCDLLLGKWAAKKKTATSSTLIIVLSIFVIMMVLSQYMAIIIPSPSWWKNHEQPPWNAGYLLKSLRLANHAWTLERPRRLPLRSEGGSIRSLTVNGEWLHILKWSPSTRNLLIWVCNKIWGPWTNSFYIRFP